jgi:hypothetical protein
VRSNKLLHISLGIFLVSTGFSQYAHAQLWSGILDPSRAIDWTQVGIPGGVPATRTQCGSTIAAGASTSTIQTALTSCASAHPVTTSSPGDGGYVLLGAGTFSLGQLNIPSNVTLRGEGADQTIISETGTTEAINMAGSEPQTGNAVNISSGSTAGSNSIVLASATGVKVGQFLYISQLNTGGVSVVGSGGTCTWCDGFSDGGARAQGQIVQVTSLAGLAVGITPALYTSFTDSPQAIPFTATKEYAGVESLQLYANNTGNSFNVLMDSCPFCWVKGIEGNYVDGNGNQVQIDFGFRDEIRDSYFTDAYAHTAGSTENEIQLAFKTSNCLIENNIIERMQTGVNLAYGSVGNVVAYNYFEGGFDQGSPAMAGTGSTYSHGANPEFNLIEGNVLPEVYVDSVWGTSMFFTAFRNWAKGTGLACTPYTGRGTVNCTGANGLWQNAASRSLQIDGLDSNSNFVGDILGSAEQEALGITLAPQLLWPGVRLFTGTGYGESFGYTSIGDGGTNLLDNTNAFGTALIHGVYNNINASLTWASGITHTLPPSFFLSSKPAWWRSDVAWPAIGPDVTGGTGPGGYTSLTESNPAMACFYNVMHGTDGGAGGPYAFNANTCYYGGSSSSGTLLPPNGLTNVVN